jgi:hypothetical protein
VLECPADVARPRLAERLDEPVDERLGLALLVAGDVLLRPADEVAREVPRAFRS